MRASGFGVQYSTTASLSAEVIHGRSAATGIQPISAIPDDSTTAPLCFVIIRFAAAARGETAVDDQAVATRRTAPVAPLHHVALAA